MNANELIAIHSFPVWLPQTQTWMYNQAKYLPETVDVHIVCERTENLDQFKLPHIHSLKDESLLRYYWEKGLRKLRIRNHLGFLTSIAKKIDAQVLHSHFGYIGWANLAAVRQAGSRHVVTFYGEDVNRFPVQEPVWRGRYHILFEKADRFLCEGKHMAACLEELGCPSEKIIVHHLGVTIGEIPYHPRHWQAGEPLRVLIAASFREKKGIPYALEALGELQSDVKLEITLIGDAGPDASSQNEKRRILEIIERTGLGSRIKMLGFQPYHVLFEEAYKHHVFLLPSVTASDGDTEGGAPVVIIEMMGTGMPVVSTSHCDIPSVVQYGIDGWLAGERDVDGLVNRLHWLLQSPDKWKGILETGRRHVESSYDATVQGSKLGQIYHSVMKKQ